MFMFIRAAGKVSRSVVSAVEVAAISAASGVGAYPACRSVLVFLRTVQNCSAAENRGIAVRACHLIGNRLLRPHADLAQPSQPPIVPKPATAGQATQPQDPSSFCYIKGEAYSEGAFLDRYGKCMRRFTPDESGKHRMYWEPSFNKQKER